MKGPGLRVDLDVRRVWRCAVCRTQRHTGGHVTSVVCHFCQDRPLMRLLEPERAARRPPQPLDMLIELHPDDVNAPAFVPVHLRETEETTEPAAPEVPAVEPIPDPQVAPAAADPAASSSVSILPDEPQSASGTEAGPAKKSRRKKGRRNKGRAQHTAGSSAASDPAPHVAAEPPSGDDDFGTGIETPP